MMARALLGLWGLVLALPHLLAALVARSPSASGQVVALLESLPAAYGPAICAAAFAVGATSTLVPKVRRLWGYVDVASHELGHGAAAVLVGGRPQALVFRADTSGHLQWQVSGPARRPRQALVALCGYPAPSLVALSLVTLPELAPLSAASLVLVSLVALLFLAGNGFALLAALAASLLLLWAAVAGALQVGLMQLAAFTLAGALAAQGIWSALAQLRLVVGRSPGAGAAGTDAAALVAWLPGPLARAATPLAAVLLLALCVLASSRATLLVLSAALASPTI